MGRTPIIRNVTTMDRGPGIRASTDNVLMAVRAHGGDFTTYDIAQVLGVEEYPVRVAMSWLVRRGIVERVGLAERPFLQSAGRHLQGRTYSVYQYRVRGDDAPAEVFAALMETFCRT